MSDSISQDSLHYECSECQFRDTISCNGICSLYSHYAEYKRRCYQAARPAHHGRPGRPVPVCGREGREERDDA